jgi:hypothetical protein
MQKIVYLPSPDLLAHALEDIGREQNHDKVTDHFTTLAIRVIEHSNEIKRLTNV